MLQRTLYGFGCIFYLFFLVQNIQGDVRADKTETERCAKLVCVSASDGDDWLCFLHRWNCRTVGRNCRRWKRVVVACHRRFEDAGQWQGFSTGQ